MTSCPMQGSPYSTLDDLLRCWDSSVGIATRYWLDGPRIESRCRRDFPQPSRQALCNGYRIYFTGVMRPGRGINHPPPSSAWVRERVVTPLLPLWAFMGCSRVNFTLYFLKCKRPKCSKIRDNFGYIMLRTVGSYYNINKSADWITLE